MLGSSLITGLPLLLLCLQGVLGWSPAYIAACGALLCLAMNYKELATTYKKKRLWYGLAWHLKETQWLFFLGLFIMVGGLTYAGISGFIAVEGLR